MRNFVSVERQKGVPLEKRELEYQKLKQNWILEKKGLLDQQELKNCTFQPNNSKKQKVRNY